VQEHKIPAPLTHEKPAWTHASPDSVLPDGHAGAPPSGDINEFSQPASVHGHPFALHAPSVLRHGHPTLHSVVPGAPGLDVEQAAGARPRTSATIRTRAIVAMTRSTVTRREMRILFQDGPVPTDASGVSHGALHL
jgi:hypothetical protein